MTNVIELRPNAALIEAVLLDGTRLSIPVDESDEDSASWARRRWIELKQDGATLASRRRQPNGELVRVE